MPCSRGQAGCLPARLMSDWLLKKNADDGARDAVRVTQLQPEGEEEETGVLVEDEVWGGDEGGEAESRSASGGRRGRGIGGGRGGAEGRGGRGGRTGRREEEEEEVEEEGEEEELQEEEGKENEDTRGWSGSASCPHSWKKNRGRSFHCCFCLSLTSTAVEAPSP